MTIAPASVAGISTLHFAFAYICVGNCAITRPEDTMQVTFADVHKICQMSGEWDRQRQQPTGNRTESRWGLFGTDLGSSFEHDGRLWFLFGDTWPARARVSSVAAVSRSPGLIDVFFLTETGVVNHLSRDQARWWDPVPLCGARFVGASRIAAVSREPKHMEVFVIGEDGVIRGRWFWDNQWHDWYVLGEARFPQTSGLAAVSRDPKHMEVFVIGEDGVIRGRWFWDNQWHDWYVLGEARFTQTSGLAAVSRDPRHMEVFAAGEDGVLRGRAFWENRWHDWYLLDDARFRQTIGLAAVSRDPKHMEVFAVGEDNLVRGRWFWDDRWHDWFVLGTAAFSQASGLAAVSPGPGLMDVFGIRENGAPWGAWFKNPGWTDWIFVETLTDSAAWTDAVAPSSDLPLQFVSTNGACARYRSPRLRGLSGELVNTGGFSVPISGFSANGKIYVFYSEYGEQIIMARTYLAVADDGDPTRLRALYVASTASMDPASDGHFVNIACTVVSEGHPGIGSALPFSAPALLMWGSGRYRKSDVYLAAVPVAHVEDRSKWWFHTGGAPSTWSPNEHDARAVFAGSVGEISVTWLDTLQVWLALYNGETPILGRVASAPWGPWSEATVLIDTDSVLGQFVHRAHADDGLSDPGRSHEGGGLYGAYVIDRFTSTFATDAVKIYFLLSTWNPYNTVLMSAHLSVR